VKNANRGRWGIVDTFLPFQPLLLYFKSKQAQNFSHNKATLHTQYHAYIHNITKISASVIGNE